MSVTVTRTKILVPRRRPDLLSRSRLISTLDDVLDYPFTLISAPAGYGKTSLMIDLAYQVSYPVCWFSIDPLDLDPNHFLTHFIHAVQIQFPEFGNAALTLLDNQADPLQDPAQVVSILINEIYQAISEHFVIFLDDFHHLNSNQEICAFISRFGQEMDDNTHLVMASRTLFNFPDLTLLIGRRMVKGIGYDELAFQNLEIKSYYHDILQRDITDEETETLLDRTEGWITGLVFSVDTDLANLPGSGKKGKVTSADLFQYLAEQVLEKQTLPIQDFLLRSSLFDEFNAGFCDQVFGQPVSGGWTDMISVLQQKNLFVQYVEDENAWIRYHTLFRDFLRTRFHNQHPEDEKKILSRLLDLYRESETWEKAFAIATQIGTPKLMAEVIDQANSTLIHQGRIKLLSSWLDLLPDEGFELNPKLLILRGISYTSLGNPKRGLSYINSIISQPAIANNPQILTRALLCRITTSRMLGHYSEAVSDIEFILKEKVSKKINETLLAETDREAALAYLNIGEYTKSRAHFSSSLNSYINLGDINNQALVHQDLGLLLMEHGIFYEARQHFDIAQETWENLNNKTQQSNILNNIGTLSMLIGKYKESAELLRSAMSYSEASSNSRMHAFVNASQGDLAKSISLFELGLTKYEQANAISEQIQEGYLLSYLALNRATILRYIGKFEDAKEYLQVARTFIVQRSSRNELGTWHLEMGFHELALKKYPSSRESFLHAEEIFKNTVKPIELAKAQIGLVLVCNEMKKSRSVHQHAKDLTASLESLETNQPLLPELHFQGQNIKDILTNISTNPAINTLVTDLDTYQRNLPQLQKQIFPNQNQDYLLKDNLNITGLGINRVLIKGKKITSPEWIYQKTVRELFFYLLTLPRGATKEQIGLVFWPDSSPSQLTCQFKNAIYRLRRSVGRDAIHYDTDTRTYHFNKEQTYSYDVEDFLTAIQKAEKEPRIPERVEYYQEAVSIYNHPYSPQLDGVWTEPVRQNLSRKYEQALLIVAEYMLDQGQNQACLKYCRKVLEVEPCQEKAFHLGFHAYAKSNDRTSLIRIYKECQNNLMEYLNIIPSKETTSLYKKFLE